MGVIDHGSEGMQVHYEMDEMKWENATFVTVNAGEVTWRRGYSETVNWSMPVVWFRPEAWRDLAILQKDWNRDDREDRRHFLQAHRVKTSLKLVQEDDVSFSRLVLKKITKPTENEIGKVRKRLPSDCDGWISQNGSEYGLWCDEAKLCPLIVFKGMGIDSSRSSSSSENALENDGACSSSDTSGARESSTDAPRVKRVRR